MADTPCPQPGCGKTSQTIFVEEGSQSGDVSIYPAAGVLWCPDHGLTETATKSGLSSPACLGRFVNAETDREFPQRGYRVWRTTVVGEPAEMMSKASPKLTFYTRVAGVRWSRGFGEVSPIRGLGPGFAIRPSSVDRSQAIGELEEIEDKLK